MRSEILKIWFGNCTVTLRTPSIYTGPVGWGCRIYRLYVCRRIRLPHRVSCYGTKQSDGEAPAMLEIWRMRNTPWLPSLPGSFWLEMVASDRVCRKGKNFVFWFGAQFNSTLNFTQSRWLILYSPDLSFLANRWVKLPNTLFLAVERRPVKTSHCGSRIAAAAWTHEGTHLIYGFLTRNPSWI